ncbi:HET-domain-containing protein [Venturia nashicola]|uniref:HET-domain-containing protein n=1 Tax=Venturia nashicola TaxID=86259 RepID=A0A4Z1PMS5_9PEZI|nr:HET-domain-containing protein [Venturia nashicola]
MHIKQVILALCLSSLAFANNHHHKNGTAIDANAAGTCTGTAVAAVGTGTAGRKKHGGTSAASNGTTTAATTGKAGYETNGTKGTSKKSQCKEIDHLTKLTSIVNNATALSEFETKHKFTAAQIDEFKAKAAKATTRLMELQANSTVTRQCAIANAEIKLMKQCKEITRLSKMAALASNTTALRQMQAKKNLTDMEIAKIKDRAKDATVKLTQLQSNTSLVAACQTIKTTGEGKEIKTGKIALIHNPLELLLI